MTKKPINQTPDQQHNANIAVSLSDLMETNIYSLAQRQYDALKANTLNKLALAYQLVKEDKLDQIEALTHFSPAGDGYGADNDFINFGWNEEYPKDIVEVTEILQDLHKAAKQAEKEEYDGLLDDDEEED